MNTTGSSLFAARDQARQWDEVVKSGWPLALERSTWAIVVALITLLYQAVAVRLFRPYTMAVFWLYQEGNRAWDADQFRVAMANTSGPISAIFCKPAYRTLLRSGNAKRKHERMLSLLWLIGAFILSIGPFFIPVFQSKTIPTVQGAPASSHDCTLLPEFNNDTTGGRRYDKFLAVDMLRTADISGYNYSGTTAVSVGLKNRKDRIAFSSSCPEWAPVCDQSNPMNIDIEYWLKKSELRIGNPNTSENLEFGVLNSCYLLERRAKLLTTDGDGRQEYGFLYGDSKHQNYSYVTSTWTPEERFGYGYTLLSLSNTGDERDIWKPNATLDHNGDRTILFYHIGTIFNKGQSKDPLFRTEDTPYGEDTYGPVRPIIPVMCNTTYALCLNQHCASINGSDALLNLTIEYEKRGENTTMAFLFLMWSNVIIPPLSFMTGSSESILAGRTLSDETTQLAPWEISGHSELVRLALAGRAMLVTSAERAASGWRKYTTGVPAEPGETLEAVLQQCRWTLVQDATRITTSGRSILIISVVGGLLLLLTFTGPVLRLLCWKPLFIFTIRWRLRTAAHLHRTTIERGDERRFWPGSVEQEWPDGSGFVDRIGLVTSDVGLHAVYRDDAQSVFSERRGDEMNLTDVRS
ncbi:hypothetical protein DM02DRAFT_395496 [Periconia macrospinosa]|uniref:Uncharacterized protein n=1 Tax=Periconia macrospinosa TaxID=97972 RepID=A0A2V1DQG7_9PLEO|nr:hypothetical protein DM02DRAFT_395496 [Periconia macrospinosa]